MLNDTISMDNGDHSKVEWSNVHFPHESKCPLLAHSRPTMRNVDSGGLRNGRWPWASPTFSACPVNPGTLVG